jgi:rubrerythrin
MEVKASNFFKEIVEKLPEEDKPLFQRFMEIEEGHEAIIKAELDGARGLGYWFDFQEFNLEAG